MPCYKPVTVWQPTGGGPIVFKEPKARDGWRYFDIPCGKCIGCRIRKREEWAVRIYCESKVSSPNWFVTWTYDDEHLPKDGGLCYRDIQLLHKRMRKKLGDFRFFIAGEYGDVTKRAHYHACYFGLQLDDLVPANGMHRAGKAKLMRSDTLRDLWGKGNHTIGEVTYESARYCAVYTTKRLGGAMADTAYSRIDSDGEIHRVEPEFAKMSLKPGIGEPFLRKYHKEIYVHDGVYIKDRKMAVPRYFDAVFEKLDPELIDKVKVDRANLAEVHWQDNTEARLAVREACKHAKEKFNKERKGPSYDL